MTLSDVYDAAIISTTGILAIIKFAANFSLQMSGLKTATEIFSFLDVS